MMDIFDIVLTVVFLVILFTSIYKCCCSSSKRGAVLSAPATNQCIPISVAGGTAQIPVVVGNPQTSYPTQMTAHIPIQMPMPSYGGVPPTTGLHTNTLPYPPHPPMGFIPPGAAGAALNPPPYDVAVPNAMPTPSNALYEKQAPYNPNFTGR